MQILQLEQCQLAPRIILPHLTHGLVRHSSTIMKLLGHRNIQNTLLYTQLVNFENDQYHSATAQSVEKAQELVESGFEYVCDFDHVKLFRKPK